MKLLILVVAALAQVNGQFRNPFLPIYNNFVDQGHGLVSNMPMIGRLAKNVPAKLFYGIESLNDLSDRVALATSAFPSGMNGQSGALGQISQNPQLAELINIQNYQQQLEQLLSGLGLDPIQQQMASNNPLELTSNFNLDAAKGKVAEVTDKLNESAGSMGDFNEVGGKMNAAAEAVMSSQVPKELEQFNKGKLPELQ